MTARAKRMKNYRRQKNIRRNNTKRINKTLENMFKNMQRKLLFAVIKTRMGVSVSKEEQELLDQHFNKDETHKVSENS